MDILGAQVGEGVETSLGTNVDRLEGFDNDCISDGTPVGIVLGTSLGAWVGCRVVSTWSLFLLSDHMLIFTIAAAMGQSRVQNNVIVIWNKTKQNIIINQQLIHQLLYAKRLK